MTDLSNNPEIPENAPNHSGTTPPWIMLSSMSLLIAGLLLASVILIQHAQEKSGKSKSVISGLSEFMKKGKSLSDQAKANFIADKPATEKTQKKEQSKVSMKRLFSKVNNGDRWPKLKLTGFGTSANGESGFAIINGKHITVGQQISETTLVEIRAHSVLVEYKGKRKFLTVAPAKK